jgi:hypothetical protein
MTMIVMKKMTPSRTSVPMTMIVKQKMMAPMTVIVMAVTVMMT